MVIGHAVDVWLTESQASFHKQYQVKVLKNDNEVLFEEQKGTDATLITQENYDKIQAIVKSA